MKQLKKFFLSLPYYLWIALFVLIPIGLIFIYSFQDVSGHLTFKNYVTFFTTPTYLIMAANSIFFAFIITLISLLISYPVAWVVNKFTRVKDLLILLIILPMWVNLLLKTYAFIGLLSRNGSINDLLAILGLGRGQFLFTDASFVWVAVYVQLPFMILPLYNSITAINYSLINASYDLGASKIQTFSRVIIPLTMPGIKSGIQAIFIPSLSLFMITRLIGGNRVITLGTAIEEHFLSTMNWGMGSTIGVVLIMAMILIMVITRGAK
ncbi:ABC transporter permease [Xylocopilactobacillus apicola]|uniref:Spermidine/putrescine ABC transporter permease n=1 Tax=Xylocopilactobacillus apicola TaxID=2932184 RepID=A0AAU9D1Z7_9LACO|nr:ABC transporter permease [Xylocopilactobacillus apicola]BDR58761.1 spermidine/putrescine ABC transporter permease [Xylocopilactobacillus apicola]